MTLAVHDFYIVMANLIGGGAGYLTELQRRQLFFSDVTMRGEMQKAEMARYEADLANTAKSRFMAAVSHDLRQPIHALGLFLGVLQTTTLSARQREIVTNVRAAADASSEMLHVLMDFSRIEAGAISPSIRSFPLQALLSKIEHEFLPQAQAQHLSFRVRPTDVLVSSDPSMLEMILRNLVSNAIRYTTEGGILLACRRQGGMAVLEVRDSGIGIDPSQHQEIFREFHQLGNPERDRRKGLGLGLAIVKGLAEALVLPLSLVSTPGRGSVFRLTLPMASAVAGVAGAIESKPVEQRTGARILLIEDDEIVRASTCQQLQDWGFVCKVAESIADALAISRHFRPELVISDYRLRNYCTGAEVITALSQQAGQQLPALLITGDTAPERIREALSFGIPLLHKPVTPEQLHQQILLALGAG